MPSIPLPNNYTHTCTQKTIYSLCLTQSVNSQGVKLSNFLVILSLDTVVVNGKTFQLENSLRVSKPTQTGSGDTNSGPVEEQRRDEE